MGRPKESIKAQLINGTNRYRIIFAEHPEWIFHTRFTNPDKAKEWAKKSKNELFASRRKGITFREMSEGFFDQGSPWRLDQEQSGYERVGHTYISYAGILNHYLIPYLGDKNIDSILGKDIKAALNSASSVLTGKPLARATKNRGIWICSLMWAWWITQGVVASSPIDHLSKYDSAPEKPRNSIPRADRAKLFPIVYEARLAIWESPMWTAFFSVMNDTGARNGEPRAWKWGDIDFEREFAPLDKAIETATACKVKETKNAKKKPGWPSKTTFEALRRWRAISKFNKDSDWVFTYNRFGDSPVSDEAADKHFKKIMRKNGYGDRGWTPYWLRHTFVTYGQEIFTENQLRVLVGDADAINGYKHTDTEVLYQQGLPMKKILDKIRED